MTFFRATLVSVLLGSAALAQNNASFVRANSFEVGGFVGASHGLDRYQVMGGGNVTYAVNKYILPYTEFTYIPGLRQQIEKTKGYYQRNLTDFHGGVHLRMPIFRESPIVPYGAFGVGLLHSNAPTGQQVNSAGTASSITGIGPSSSLAVNGGGGLRFYIGQRFGLRTEAKVYHSTSDSLRATFYKVEFGVFFQIR